MFSTGQNLRSSSCTQKKSFQTPSPLEERNPHFIRSEVALLFFFIPCYVDWENCELRLVGKHAWNVWILVFRSLAVPLVGMTSSFVTDMHFLSIGGRDWVARSSRGSHVYPWRSLVLQQWFTCSSYAILTNFHLAVHHCVQEEKLVNITPKISAVWNASIFFFRDRRSTCTLISSCFRQAVQ